MFSGCLRGSEWLELGSLGVPTYRSGVGKQEENSPTLLRGTYSSVIMPYCHYFMIPKADSAAIYYVCTYERINSWLNLSLNRVFEEGYWAA